MVMLFADPSAFIMPKYGNHDAESPRQQIVARQLRMNNISPGVARPAAEHEMAFISQRLPDVF